MWPWQMVMCILPASVFSNVTIWADAFIVWAPVLPLIALAILCVLLGTQLALSIGHGLGIEHELDESRISTGYIVFGFVCSWALYTAHAVSIDMPRVIIYSLLMMPAITGYVACIRWVYGRSREENPARVSSATFSVSNGRSFPCDPSPCTMLSAANAHADGICGRGVGNVDDLESYMVNCAARCTVSSSTTECSLGSLPSGTCVPPHCTILFVIYAHADDFGGS
jgi:hypothetical protein